MNKQIKTIAPKQQPMKPQATNSPTAEDIEQIEHVDPTPGPAQQEAAPEAPQAQQEQPKFVPIKKINVPTGAVSTVLDSRTKFNEAVQKLQALEQQYAGIKGEAEAANRELIGTCRALASQVIQLTAHEAFNVADDGRSFTVLVPESLAPKPSLLKRLVNAAKP